MSVIFLGGDDRQQYASDYVNGMGISSTAYINFSFNKEIKEEIKNNRVLVFPLPTSRDDINLNMMSRNNMPLSEIINSLNAQHLIIGGNIGSVFYDSQEKIGYKIIDYNKLESFQIQNALLSAEGAIHYAKTHFGGAIYGSRIAILGFGRIGKILAYLLKSMGANISVYARKDQDCTWSTIIGFNAHKIQNLGVEVGSKRAGEGYDLIFNTIPQRIIGDELAMNLSRDTVIIDLASYPYGMDQEIGEKYKLSYYRELGIPGRYAPQRAGEIIGKTVISILQQENCL